MSDGQYLEKRCPKCGFTKPLDAFSKDKSNKDSLDNHCKACRAAYYAANAEARRECNRAWKAANGESIREYARAWKTLNPEYHHKYSRAHHAANVEAYREQSRAYARANADKLREYSRAHHAAHPDIYRAAKHRRRARIKANGGNVTAHELAAKRVSQGGFCFYCQMPHEPQALTIDHVIPIDQGGPHIIANIVFACDICNKSKGNRSPEQWTDRWYQRLKN